MKQRKERYERYDFEASPWVQNLNQRQLAELLGWKKHRLEALIRDKDRYIRRTPKEISGKLRNLAVPVGKLRSIHERIKFHLNKIKQPDYLYSPRKSRGQRDNAAYHADGNQFLSLDIKQFYPSTTDEHIFRWAYHVAGLRSEVAGLFTKLVAIDNKMPFGSPVSPVLTALVHRDMFDQIYSACQAHGLKMSVWVDDLMISGSVIRGEIIDEIRNIIRQKSLKSHKIKFQSWTRPVLVTGVPIIDSKVMAPRGVHKRIEDGYALLKSDLSDWDRNAAIDRLLGALGTHRYHVGSETREGRLSSNRMHALRQRRPKAIMRCGPPSVLSRPETDRPITLPWDAS